MKGFSDHKTGTWGAVGDDNSITFGREFNELAERIANYLSEQILELEKSTPLTSSTTGSNSPQVSPVDEIRKYKSLLDDGIITQVEFESKKKQLLGL